ncbi:hypothetical protein [Methylobacterium sp. ID0610]|uniref:hypothetical protein n=1 Tax=Methylobacterium carpenticola TaxID=3344827 RepID=UPI0036925654
MSKNKFKRRRIIFHRQMLPGGQSGWSDCPLTDLGRPGKGIKKAWVPLSAAGSSRPGWAEKPGFGKLYYDYAFPMDSAHAHPSVLKYVNHDATALLMHPDTVPIGKRKLYPNTHVLGHAWLAPDRGILQPYLEIRKEHVGELVERAAELGISIDEGADICSAAWNKSDRVHVMVPHTSGMNYAAWEKKMWEDDPDWQADEPNPDWDKHAWDYDAFWPAARIQWA